MIFPMIVGKLVGGATAIAVAIVMMPKNIAEEEAAAAPAAETEESHA